MSNSCPISFKQIDSNVSRLTSFFISSLVVAYLVYAEVFVLYLLAIDFSLRLFVDKKYSPFYLSSLFVKKRLNFKDKFVDSGAARLAAYFGLLFVLGLLVSHYVGMYSITLVIAAIFLSCSLLYVFLDFCIGCKIYFIIKKIFPSFMS